MKIFAVAFAVLFMQAFVAEEAHADCVDLDLIHKDGFHRAILRNGCDYDVMNVRSPLVKIWHDFSDSGFNSGAIACEGIANINQRKGGESKGFGFIIKAGETVEVNTNIPDECSLRFRDLCWMSADDPDWAAWNKCANRYGKWKETKKRDGIKNPLIAELTQKAERGDVDAQYQLGLAHEKGIGVAQNAEKAAKWYRLAAEQGDSKAQRSLAEVSSEKQGNAESPYIDELRQRAEGGDAEAQYKLFLAYSKGIGIAQNDELAAKWLRLAANNGHGKAKSRLAQSEPQKQPQQVAAASSSHKDIWYQKPDHDNPYVWFKDMPGWSNNDCLKWTLARTEEPMPQGSYSLWTNLKNECGYDIYHVGVPAIEIYGCSRGGSVDDDDHTLRKGTIAKVLYGDQDPDNRVPADFTILGSGKRRNESTGISRDCEIRLKSKEVCLITGPNLDGYSRWSSCMRKYGLKVHPVYG